MKSPLARAWMRFKWGLGCFVVGAILILTGANTIPLVQIPGLIFLAFGVLLSGWGYWGILVIRLRSFRQIGKKSK